MGWPLVNPSSAHCTDVGVGTTYYSYVETAYAHGLIAGYADGRFRPSSEVMRG